MATNTLIVKQVTTGPNGEVIVWCEGMRGTVKWTLTFEYPPERKGHVEKVNQKIRVNAEKASH